MPLHPLQAVYLFRMSSHRRDDLLAASIKLLIKHVSPYTPTDPYIFTNPGEIESLEQGVREVLEGMVKEAQLCVLDIPP